MKVKAAVILIRGRKIIADLQQNDVILPGGSVDADKAQDQLKEHILE